MKRLKRKSKIFIALSCLFAFIGLFAFSSYAYEFDSNGNMVSSNLMNYQDISSSKFTDLGDYQFQMNWGGSSSTITLPSVDYNANTSYTFSLTLVSGTYGYSMYNMFWNYTDGTSVRFTSNQGLSAGRYSFTSNNSKTLSSITWFVNFNAVFEKLMLNVGSTAIDFEPYGYTWYSQNNYNTYGIQQYNSGYNNATDDLLADMITFSVMNNYYSNAIAFVSTDRGSTYSSYTSAVDFEQTDTYLLAELSDNVSWGTLDNGFMYYFDVSFTTPLNLYRVYTPASQSCVFTSIEIDGQVFSGFNYSYIDGVGSWYLDNINTLCSGFKIYFYGSNNSSNDIYLYATGYNTGATAYQNGYDKGVSDTTSQYESVVNSLNDTISSLSSQLSTLNKKLKTLEKGVSNYQNLIWTIGATPWESFKHIWNVEFGGINIANIVTGFVTALLVIYLIKKFWR